MKVAACLVLLAGSASSFAPAALSSKVGTSLPSSSSLHATTKTDGTEDDRRRFLQNAAAASLAALAGSGIALPEMASASGGATAGKYT